MNVYILNIQSAEKRRYMCEGALFAMKFPFKNVKHWEAIDDWNYEFTSDMMRDAIKDGFPAFQQYLDKGQQNEYNIGTFTQTWNYCRFWRHLVDNNETAMLIQDDRKINAKYCEITGLLEAITEIDPEFMFMSLWSKGIEDQFLPMRWVSEELPIAHGIYACGACAGHIVSPQGAQWLIDNIIGYFPPRVEYAVLARCREKDHFYTLADEELNVDHLVTDNRDYLPGGIISEDGFVRPIHTTADK